MNNVNPKNLTFQYGKNHAVPVKFDLDFSWGLDKKTWQGLSDIFDRLNAYEKTGLEPEEIHNIKNNKENKILK